MRLLATSDIHINHRENRDALLDLPAFPEDWLIVAGDIGERAEHLVFALDALVPRFARVFWTAGNHDLWSPFDEPARTRGQARYDELVDICHRYGVVTPEDEYVEWPDGSGTVIVPMFLLFDYSFRPPEVAERDAVSWARSTGVVSGDERMLSPAPWSSISAWCHDRCERTVARLEALPSSSSTILINHWPLRYDLARPPRVPRFSLWSGTTRTEDWGRRFRARAVINGHLHMRTTLWRQDVRYDEVSLGYPRDWRRERGMAWYLREVLPEASAGSERFVPPRDPFLDTSWRRDARSIIPRP